MTKRRRPAMRAKRSAPRRRPARKARARRSRMNVGRLDRAVRILIAVWALSLAQGNPWWYVLTAYGLISAVAGYDWFYNRLGINTARR